MRSIECDGQSKCGYAGVGDVGVTRSKNRAAEKMSLIAPAGSAMGPKLRAQPHIIRRRSEPYSGRRALSPAKASNQMNHGCHHMHNQIEHVAHSQCRIAVKITAIGGRQRTSYVSLRCMLIMSLFCFGSFEPAICSQLRSLPLC